MAVIPATELKTGARPVRKEERTYKEGEDLFREGERGDEMFVLEEGEVAVTKKLEEGVVELAKLKPPAMIGEMALLDNMPRSATVKAVSLSKVTIINRLVFEAVMAKVPLWLRSIVKIVISRLRDANTRVGKSILRDNECGVANLVLLMSHRYGKSQGEALALSLNVVRNFMTFTSRLTARNFSAALEALKKRKLLETGRDTAGNEQIYIKDIPAVRLFVEFRKLAAQGRQIVGADLNEKHHEFLSNVNYVSQKLGTQTPEGIFLPVSAMDFGEEKDNRAFIRELEKKGVLSMPETGVYGDEEGILYDKNTLNKARKVREWLPLFTLSVTAEGRKP